MSSERKTWKRPANDAERRQRRLASRKKWKKAHWQEILAGLREKRRTDPVWRERERVRGRKSTRKRLLASFGLTLADYDRMLAEQDGRCGLCRHKSKKTLAVDHCHKPRRIRRLLCNSCNSMLAFAGDDPDVLVRAAVYLLETDEPALSTVRQAAKCFRQLKRALHGHGAGAVTDLLNHWEQ
jgi:hypothetical protein